MKRKILIITLFSISLSLVACEGALPGGKSSRESSSSSGQGESSSLSLYDDKSVFYFNNQAETVDVPIYHLDSKDIPYISFTSASKMFNGLAGSNVTKVLHQGNKYVLTRSDYKLYSFDVSTNELILEADIDHGITNVVPVNNNVVNDVTYYPEAVLDIVHASTSTKYLYQPQIRKIDLDEYNIKIKEDNNDLYVPLALHGLMNELACGAPLGTCDSFLYNGKDIIASQSASVISASLGNSSSKSFMLPYVYEIDNNAFDVSIAMSPVSTSGSEAYRFEGDYDKEEYGSNEDIHFTLILDANGGGSLTTSQAIDSYTREISYSYSANNTNIIVNNKIKNGSTTKYDYNIGINLGDGNYLKETRASSLAEFEYSYLELFFNNFYGIADSSNRDFTSLVNKLNIKKDLLSTNIKTYEDAFAKLLLAGVDDAHTSLLASSYYRGQRESIIKKYNTDYPGVRKGGLLAKQDAYKQARSQALGTVKAYEVVGDTAFITFDSFSLTHTLHKLDYYKDIDPNDTNNDTCYLVGSAMYQVSQNSAVNNVVFDITCNGGGTTVTLAFILGMMKKDPIILMDSRLDYSLKEFHYTLDLDGNSVYSEDNDSFEGKYNFYILTSDFSFSCANELATCAKNMKCAKVIGKKSAGGTRVVANYATPTGFTFNTSSTEGFMIKDRTNGKYHNNDGGVPVDVEVEESLWYNRLALVEKLKTI